MKLLEQLQNVFQQKDATDLYMEQARYVPPLNTTFWTIGATGRIQEDTWRGATSEWEMWNRGLVFANAADAAEALQFIREAALAWHRGQTLGRPLLGLEPRYGTGVPYEANDED